VEAQWKTNDYSRLVLDQSKLTKIQRQQLANLLNGKPVKMGILARALKQVEIAPHQG
jgi:hypothetical protein